MRLVHCGPVAWRGRGGLTMAIRAWAIQRREIGGVVAAAAALACVLAGAAGAVDVGANDDTGKYAADGGAPFYGQMAALGLKQSVITVRWTPSDPTAVVERALLDVTVPIATAAGLKVVF